MAKTKTIKRIENKVRQKTHTKKQKKNGNQKEQQSIVVLLNKIEQKHKPVRHLTPIH